METIEFPSHFDDLPAHLIYVYLIKNYSWNNAKLVPNYQSI